MSIKWNVFLDKVYGCWLGKCVAGTIGAPYEGYKGRMNIDFDPKMFETALPNDDLDLQVLWLEVVEKKGDDFTADDLAEIFYEKCPYAPGEYATFKKNHLLGLRPPLTGSFNNNYYIEGMGCPIRSEIWACLAPGNPEIAIKHAEMDGSLDHSGESVIAEQFMAAMESIAFTYSKPDTKSLIVKALDYIDKQSKFYAMCSQVLELCEKYDSIETVMGFVMRDYGHPDCTNMFQNMAVVIASLILGGGDFEKTVIMALNCGFDTDCTCATAGSVIGILLGGDTLTNRYNLPPQTYKLGVNTTRRTDSVYDLAVDTANAALLFNECFRDNKIKDYPQDVAPKREAGGRFQIFDRIVYDKGTPEIHPGETKNISIVISSVYKIKAKGKVMIDFPEGFYSKKKNCTNLVKEFKINTKSFFGKDECVITFPVTCDENIPVLMEKNIFSYIIEVSEGDRVERSFGLVGAKIWKVYGPFWENTTNAPAPKALESYYAYLGGGKNESEDATIIRQFHLNMKADMQKEYLEKQLLSGSSLPESLAKEPAYTGFSFYSAKDLFSFDDIMKNRMPCVLYLVRDLVVPEERKACLQIGYSEGFRMWIDGDLIAYSDDSEHWTPENIHKKYIALHAGKNRIVLKLSRVSGASDFSIMFTENGPCTDHIVSFGSGRL